MKRQPKQPVFHEPKVAEATAEDMVASTATWPIELLIEAGKHLHEGRKVAPIAEDEAPKDTPYDNRVGITYAPLDFSKSVTSIEHPEDPEAEPIRRNFLIHVKALPRRIGTTEVAKEARGSCKRCYGVGKWKVTRMQEVGREHSGKLMQQTEFEVTCRCAEDNYKKNHKQFLIDSQLGEWIALEGLEITKVEEKQDAGLQPTDPVVPNPQDPGRPDNAPVPEGQAVESPRSE
jgi:hypothetical protein